MTVKPRYKAVILVLASGDACEKNNKYLIPRFKEEWKPLYPTFKLIWEAYQFANPNIKVLFVYGKDSIDIQHEYDLVYDVFENDYPGMITKTLLGMADIEARYDYDYLIRTNLSTFWDLNLLETRLDQLPKQQCLTGTTVHIKKENLQYIAGYDMVISRDLIQSILPYISDIIKYKVYCNMEDLMLCTAIKNYANVDILDSRLPNSAIYAGMSVYSAEQYNAIRKMQQQKKADHFRIKTRHDRNVDKNILKQLLYDVYEKNIL